MKSLISEFHWHFLLCVNIYSAYTSAELYLVGFALHCKKIEPVAT